MRLCTDMGDPAYDATMALIHDKTKKITVLFNGESVEKQVTMADEEAGLIRRPVFGPNGNILIKGEFFEEEMVSGVVVITIEEASGTK